MAQTTKIFDFTNKNNGDISSRDNFNPDLAVGNKI